MIYRSVGGGVPGQGVTDTVPAMLTPGEFVLRRSAVSSIGLGNLQSLNSGMIGLGEALNRGVSRNVSHFNSGGLVPGMSSSGGGDSKVISIGDIIINNPVAQASEDSIADVHADLAFRYGF